MTAPKSPRQRTATKRVTPTRVAKKRPVKKIVAVKKPLAKALPPKRKAPAKVKPPPEPNPMWGFNRRAAEVTIQALRDEDRLVTVDSARIALQALAGAVDADPHNASLWREYRAAEESLREVNDEDTDDLEALLRAVSAPVGNQANAKSADSRSRGRRSS